MGSRSTRYIPLLILLLLLLSGCAGQQQLTRERFFWPPPPNPPRLEWLGVYHSQLDLQKTALRRLKEVVVGVDAPIALRKPIDAKSDAVGDKLYVADYEAAAVFIFDERERELRRVQVPAKEQTGGFRPISLALDGQRNLYLLDMAGKRILVYTPAEDFLHAIRLEEFCQRPVSLAIDKQRGRLYVGDADLSAIFVLDLAGKRISSLGGPGDATGRFNRPVGLAVTPQSELLVADAFNARIQVFDQEGRFLRTFGRRGTGPADFQLIKGVAVDPDGNIYVVDGRSSSVKIFNPAGELLFELGDYYAVGNSGKLVPAGFALPVAIDIDGRGRVMVVDQLNAQVQIFQYLPEAGSLPGGVPTGQITVPGVK